MLLLIDNLRKTRRHVLDLIKDLSLEKLNKIPHGFNNNIMWNVGHLVAAQQSICYTRAGLPSPIPEDSYKNFKPGTRPEKFVESDEEDEIKKLLFSSIDVLEKDYHRNAFGGFKSWTTRLGITLNNIDDAIHYLHFHEGLHTGVIASMRKLVQK
jgi:hypothetical protein